MLQITMPLSASVNDFHAEMAECRPVAAVEVAIQGKHKHVTIQLQGAIVGEHTTAFLDFLKAVSHFVGTHWAVQMKDLKVMSLQGIWHLVQFAELLRARGQKLEVHSVHRNVYVTLQELDVVRVFSWAD